MITYQQIRRMIRPYSDVQIGNAATETGLLNSGNAWGNGAIMFFEPTPERFQDGMTNIDPCSDAKITGLLDFIEIAAKRRVYLTAIGETVSDSTQYHAFFEDSQGNRSHADGRYITLICRKAGRQARNITWQSLDIDGRPAILASLLDRPLAIVAQLDGGRPALWEWELKNSDLPRESRPLPRWTEPARQVAQVALAF